MAALRCRSDLDPCPGEGGDVVEDLRDSTEGLSCLRVRPSGALAAPDRSRVHTLRWWSRRSPRSSSCSPWITPLTLRPAGKATRRRCSRWHPGFTAAPATSPPNSRHLPVSTSPSATARPSSPTPPPNQLAIWRPIAPHSDVVGTAQNPMNNRLRNRCCRALLH